MKEVISGRNILKYYGEGAEKSTVLAGVNVSVHEGEFVSVMGPSGSGKSTLLFAVSGMDTIDGGSISFCGRDFSQCGENELADLRRTQMGFVFQQPALLKNLNLLDNIIFPAMQDDRRKLPELIERAKKLMRMTGIDGLENRETTKVSGGQLQRAGICRALMCNPKIVFADEPTGALNSKAAQEIMEILTGINEQGTSLLLVTHDPKVAARSERILFLSDGKVIQELKLSKYADGDLAARTARIQNSMKMAGI